MAILGGFYRVTGLGATGLPASILGLLVRPPMIPLAFTLAVGGPVPAEFPAPPQSCQAENDQVLLLVTVVDVAGAPVNLRNATTLALALQRPDGTTRSLPATLRTNGLDGGLQYATKAADVREAGPYQLQAAFTIAGAAQTTRWGRFRVGPNIDA